MDKQQREQKEKQLYALLEELAGDSNYIDHVKREVPDTGEPMQNMMRAHLIRMGQLFAIEGHSGFSASYAVSALEKLLRFEPLGPLTGEPDEWVELDYDDDMKAQNKRCSHVFRRADGTAYDIEARIFREPDGACFTGKGSSVDITFPYTPTREYVDVPAGRD